MIALEPGQRLAAFLLSLSGLKVTRRASRPRCQSRNQWPLVRLVVLKLMFSISCL